MPSKSIFNAIDIKPEGGVASKVRLLDATGAYAVELVAPAGMTGPVSMGLPATTGAANEVLTADGLGGQYWSPGVPGPTGPTGPAGSNGLSGKVVQVVSATTSTPTTVATTTYTDTTLSATITPTSSANTILVLVMQNAWCSRSSSNQGVGIRLLRNGTVIYTPVENTTGPYLVYRAFTGVASMSSNDNVYISHRDSPATTSAVTYKTQGRPYTIANAGSCVFQDPNDVNIASSSIVLVEIAP